MLLSVKYLSVLLLLVLTFSACKQKNTPSPEELHTIKALNNNCAAWALRDSVKILAQIDSVEQVAKQDGNKAYFLDAELIRVFFYILQQKPGNIPRLIAMLEKIRQEATKNNFDYINARAEERYGHVYHQTQNLEQVFDHWQKALAISYTLKNPDDGGISGIAPILYYVGDLYYYFGEYRNSIFYLHQLVPRLKDIEDFNRVQTLNTLGFDYQKLGMPDSSDYYFRQCYQLAKATHNYNWQGIAHDGLGINLFLRGKYDQAVPLLKENVGLGIKRKDWWSVCGSLMVLADISLKKNDIAGAASLLKLTQMHIHDAYMLMRPDRLPVFYPLMAKLYAAEGKGKEAQLYIDSTVIINDSFNRRARKIHLMRMQQRIEIVQQNELVSRTLAEAAEKRKEHSLLIALVVAVSLLSASIYLLQRRKYRQEQQMREIRLKQQEYDLELSKEQLHELTKSMSEKNRLITLFQQRLNLDDNETFDELRKSNILTDRDWERFKFLFEKVHSGYLDALTRKLPGISKAEIRYLALAKLNMNNKEMAIMLAVSPESLRVTWHRLRKKMQLPDETTVEELVAGII